jgi:hypothetical protein
LIVLWWRRLIVVVCRCGWGRGLIWHHAQSAAGSTCQLLASSCGTVGPSDAPTIGVPAMSNGAVVTLV